MFPTVTIPIYIPTEDVRLPYQHHLSNTLYPTFLITAILTGMRYHTVALICISLISNAEHLFVCLLAISMHSLVIYSDPMSTF